jgi:transposase-like protein
MPPAKKKQPKNPVIRCGSCKKPHNVASNGAVFIGSIPHFKCASCGVRNPVQDRQATPTSTR